MCGNCHESHEYVCMPLMSGDFPLVRPVARHNHRITPSFQTIALPPAPYAHNLTSLVATHNVLCIGIGLVCKQDLHRFEMALIAC